jgi:DNA adenine methylase
MKRLTSSLVSAMIWCMGYPGGKAGMGTFHRIISLMPPHEIYIEPFMGGFSIGRLKRPATLNVGIDRDRAAVEKARPPAESLNGAVEASNAETGERRRQDAHEPARADPLARNIEASGSRWQFLEDDGIAFLEMWQRWWKLDNHAAQQTRSTLIYCDPPYLRSTCKTRCRYKFDMTVVDHCRLLRVLQDLNALPEPPMLMISGYDSELYREILTPEPGSPVHLENISLRHPWSHVSFEAMTRGGKKATEHLWFNFAPPTVLHDYRYVGTNFRDRERIKRAQKTWTEKLKRLKPYEREALLNAIGETAGTGDADRNAVK